MGKTLLSMTNHNLSRCVCTCVFHRLHRNQLCHGVNSICNVILRYSEYMLRHIGFQFSIYIAIQFAQMIFNCIAVMDSFHFSTMRPIYTFFSYKFHLIVIQLGVLVLNGLLNQSFWSSFRFDIYLGVLTIDSFDCLEMKRIWIWLVKHTSFLSVGREAWKNYSAKNSWTFYIKLYNGKWVRYTSSNVKLYTIYTCMNEWAL